MLVSLRTVLAWAEENDCAAAAFDTPNLELLLAAIGAAEERDEPVIIQHAQLHEEETSIDVIGPIMVARAEASRVPVCVMLDHGEDIDYVRRALDLGFSAIMIDGSQLPYEENVALTLGAVELAHEYGADVEAEIGFTTGHEGLENADDDRETMKQIAAGGFKDITRIASASPEMWEQICMTNTGNIAEMLERYITSLQSVLSSLRGRDEAAIYRLFDSSRAYRNSISDRSRGAIEPEYSFSVDIVDEVGSISTLSVILAAKGISIKNIGINHSREHGEGALRISFYDEEARTAAWNRLTDYKYTLIP